MQIIVYYEMNSNNLEQDNVYNSSDNILLL